MINAKYKRHPDSHYKNSILVRFETRSVISCDGRRRYWENRDGKWEIHSESGTGVGSLVATVAATTTESLSDKDYIAKYCRWKKIRGVSIPVYIPHHVLTDSFPPNRLERTIILREQMRKNYIECEKYHNRFSIYQAHPDPAYSDDVLLLKQTRVCHTDHCTYEKRGGGDGGGGSDEEWHVIYDKKHKHKNNNNNKYIIHKLSVDQYIKKYCRLQIVNAFTIAIYKDDQLKQ